MTDRERRFAELEERWHEAKRDQMHEPPRVPWVEDDVPREAEDDDAPESLTELCFWRGHRKKKTRLGLGTRLCEAAGAVTAFVVMLLCISLYQMEETFDVQ